MKERVEIVYLHNFGSRYGGRGYIRRVRLSTELHF